MTDQELINEIQRKAIELTKLPIPELNELKDLGVLFDEMAEKMSKLPHDLRMPATIIFLKAMKKYNIL